MKNLEHLMNDWYGRISDIEEALIDEGLRIEEANREYIEASYEDGDETVYIVLFLSGERTITIDRIEEERI